MPKYLMIDHGGVLDGIISQNEPDSNDLLIEEIITDIDDVRRYQVLKNGVEIVKQLNALVKKYDYEIVFHSKCKEKEQIDLLEKLKKIMY